MIQCITHRSACLFADLAQPGEDELRHIGAASLFIIHHSALIVRGTVVLVSAQREGGWARSRPSAESTCDRPNASWEACQRSLRERVFPALLPESRVLRSPSSRQDIRYDSDRPYRPTSFPSAEPSRH